VNDNATMGDLKSRARAVAENVAECQRLLATAEHQFHAGDLRASGEAAIRAGELARLAGRPELLAAAALVVTGVQDPLIDAGVESMCREALATVEPTNAVILARLHAQLAVAQYHRGRVGDGATSSERAMQLAVQTDDPAASAAALHARRMTAVGLVRPLERIDLGQRMLGLAEQVRSTEREMLGHAWRIDGFLQLADTDSAGLEIDALDVLAAGTGEPLVKWHALRSRAGWSQAVGAFAEAERLALMARDALPPSQASFALPLYYTQLAMVGVDRGMRPSGMEAMGPLAAGRIPVILAMMAVLDLAVGDRDGARATFESVKPRVPDLSRDGRWLPTIAAITELAVTFGDESLAATLHGELVPFEGVMIAAAMGAVGPVGYYLGLVDASCGRLDSAIERLEAAADLAVRGDFGPSLVRIRAALADALGKRGVAGDRERAARLAAMAAADARRLGMHGLLVRVKELAASLDRSPSHLSRREQEVVAHVAAGESNREIATLLFLSERTVETHVRNILTKLDLHSRTQVAAWATKAAISGEPSKSTFTYRGT
jgi:DNA-binding CsgD family transcriptional regulator